MLFTYQELIDLAIGSPESGHVNFYALQVLLTCFAQRLEVLDKVVEVQNSFLLGKDSEFRMFAGADAEDAAPEEQANEATEEPAVEDPDEEEAVEEAPVEEAPVEEAPVEEAPVEEAPVEEAPVEEAPVEEAPVEEAPVEEAPVEEAPVEQAPAEQAPVEESLPPPPIDGEVKTEVNIPDKTDGDATAPGTQPVPATDTAEVRDQGTTPSHKEEESLHSVRSSVRKLPSTVDPAIVSTVMRLEKRVAIIEVNNEKATLDMDHFFSRLKLQMMLTIEQVNNVAHLLIDRRQDPDRIKAVRLFAKQLKALLETGDGREVSVSWSSDEGNAGADQEEGVLEDDFLEEEDEYPEDVTATRTSATLNEEHPLDLEEVHSEVLQLKAQFCALTNKVNELAATLMKHDCQMLLEKFEELKNTIHDLHLFRTRAEGITTNIMEILNKSTKQIESLQKSAVLLDERKCDKMEMELMMAEKVNFKQLATKISLTQLDDHKFAVDKMICEVRHIIGENERNVLQIIDNLRLTLGIDAMEVGLKDFRVMVERRVGMIADALQRYMEMTNDECAAAAGRVKVMQDLACLSCDSTCIMRTVERQKLPSLPKAKGSVGLAPVVTYELGQIRGTGLMGYYPKDEFPCSPHAWTKGTSRVPLDKCNPRHAGGLHTVHTAEEHMQKVVLSKRNSGWM